MGTLKEKYYGENKQFVHLLGCDYWKEFVQELKVDRFQRY
jgi:hypothetical protein